MTTLSKIKENWFDFGMSYLYLADLACKEMQKKEDREYYAGELYIATIFNIKHGIEVNLKSLIVLLEDRQISKKLEHHNQEEIMNEFHRLIGEKKIINLIETLTKKNENNAEWIFKEIKGKKDIILTMLDMAKLVSKYHQLSFLKDKISSDFIIEDTNNTAFKYPQNNLLIKLDYKEIIKKIDKVAILKIAIDVSELLNYFLTLNMLFYECIKEKKHRN